MKISPLINLNNSILSNSIKESGVSPQQKPIESGSLELLSNYNKANLNLSFQGDGVERIKAKCKKALHKAGMSDVVCCSLFTPDDDKYIANIKFDLIKSLLKKEGIEHQDILQIVHVLSDDEDKIRTQANLAKTLLTNDKFSIQHIRNLIELINCDPDIAQVQEDVVKILLKNGQFSASDAIYFVQYTKRHRDIAQTQKELLENLSQNEKFSNDDLKKIYSSVNFLDYDAAQIQKELAIRLVKVDKMNGSNIANIIESFSQDVEDSKIRESFINEAINNEKMTGTDIENIVKNIGDSIITSSKAQYDFIKNLEKEGYLQNRNVITSLDLIIRDISNSSKAQEILTLIKELDELGCLQNQMFKKDPKAIYHTIEYKKKRPDTDIKGVLQYMEKIDFDKLGELAPLTKTFDFNQYLTFCDYNFRGDKKREFSEDDLKFKADLREFLSDNFLDADSLNDLFSAYPMTQREVGKMPESWLNQLNENEWEKANSDIYNAISDFQNKGDLFDFSKKLSDILKRDITVDYAGKGSFGTCYRIGNEDGEALCLKIFNQRDQITNKTYNRHGQHVELQKGLFVNRHSDKFVKLYFGKLSPLNCQDGFLVTQFLDFTTEVDNDFDIKNDDLYQIEFNDRRANNLIDGVIIDYGGVDIIDTTTQEPAIPYSIFAD